MKNREEMLWEGIEMNKRTQKLSIQLYRIPNVKQVKQSSVIDQ